MSEDHGGGEVDGGEGSECVLRLPPLCSLLRSDARRANVLSAAMAHADLAPPVELRAGVDVFAEYTADSDVIF